MAREKTSPIEDLITVVGRLPWWACVVLAIISYLVLHMLAVRPVVAVAVPGQMGDVALQSMFRALAMFAQYIFPFAFGFAALISCLKAIKRKKIYTNTESRRTVAAFNDMSWQDFERLVEVFYRRKDFLVSREGIDGPDGGVDLVLRKGREIYLVQCKQWKAYKVGVQPVREFYGSMAARGAVGGYFVTSGTYTDDAKAFAYGTNLELVDGIKLRWMIDTASKAPLTPGMEVGSKPSSVTPVCPKCGATMAKRVARQGGNAGTEFWGCPAFPRCSGTRPLEDNRHGR
jgi:restriction system protein